MTELDLSDRKHVDISNKKYFKRLLICATWNDIPFVLDCLLLNFDLISQSVYIVFDIKLNLSGVLFSVQQNFNWMFFCSRSMSMLKFISINKNIGKINNFCEDHTNTTKNLINRFLKISFRPACILWKACIANACNALARSLSINV